MSAFILGLLHNVLSVLILYIRLRMEVVIIMLTMRHFLSYVHYIKSGRILMVNEVGKIWKWSWPFKGNIWAFIWSNWGKLCKHKPGLSGFRSKNRARDLPSTKQECISPNRHVQLIVGNNSRNTHIGRIQTFDFTAYCVYVQNHLLTKLFNTTVHPQTLTISSVILIQLMVSQ